MSNPLVPSALHVLGEELYAGWGIGVNAFTSFKMESNLIKVILVEKKQVSWPACLAVLLGFIWFYLYCQTL